MLDPGVLQRAGERVGAGPQAVSHHDQRRKLAVDADEHPCVARLVVDLRRIAPVGAGIPA